MKNIDHLFMAEEDFFRSAKKSVLFKRTAKKIRREEEKKLIDKVAIANNKAWSILGHQVFGAEVF